MHSNAAQETISKFRHFVVPSPRIKRGAFMFTWLPCLRGSAFGIHAHSCDPPATP